MGRVISPPPYIEILTHEPSEENKPPHQVGSLGDQRPMTRREPELQRQAATEVQRIDGSNVLELWAWGGGLPVRIPKNLLQILHLGCLFGSGWGVGGNWCTIPGSLVKDVCCHERAEERLGLLCYLPTLAELSSHAVVGTWPCPSSSSILTLLLPGDPAPHVH